MTDSQPDDTIPTLRKNWESATGDALVARARSLGLDYLVVERSSPHDQIANRPVFENGQFAVFATR